MNLSKTNCEWEVMSHYVDYIRNVYYSNPDVPWCNMTSSDHLWKNDAEPTLDSHADNSSAIDAAVEWHTQTSCQDKVLVHEDQRPGSVEVKPF